MSRSAGCGPRLLTAASGLLGALVVALLLGALYEDHQLSAAVERLSLERGLPDESLDFPGSLPEPVERYLRQANPSGLRIAAVRLRQSGTLRADPRSDRWLPFEAVHIAVPPAAAFVWDARISIAPLIHLRVRDSLIGGIGSGRVALLSALRLASAGGTEAMTSGSLHRFLAESVWYPSALLPSRTLRWEPIDAERSRATLTEAGTTVSLDFRFGAAGEVLGIYTPGRWGSFDGGYRQVPWEGRFAAHEQVEGLLIPLEAEVGWYLDGTWLPVWRGRIDPASFELSE